MRLPRSSAPRRQRSVSISHEDDDGYVRCWRKKMRDLDDALKQVERNSPPDLWPVIQDRNVGSPAPTIAMRPRQWSTILVAAVVSLVAIGFAWKAFGSESSTPGAEPSATSLASDTTPPVGETLQFRNGPEWGKGPDSGEFAPPLAGSQPALSADEALGVFFQDNPGIQFNQSDIRSLSIGLTRRSNQMAVMSSK